MKTRNKNRNQISLFGWSTKVKGLFGFYFHFLYFLLLEYFVNEIVKIVKTIKSCFLFLFPIFTISFTKPFKTKNTKNKNRKWKQKTNKPRFRNYTSLLVILKWLILLSFLLKKIDHNVLKLNLWVYQVFLVAQ